MGHIYSKGMDVLAQRLGAIGGVKCTADDYGFAYSNTDDIATAAREAYRNGAAIVLIGHSMGGDTVLKASALLAPEDVPVALAICIDPTPFGCPPVSANVKYAIGYFNTLPGQLGGYQIKPGVGFDGDLETYPMAIAHIDIDDDPEIHKRIKAEVQKLI